jgi:hypothetical protein
MVPIWVGERTPHFQSGEYGVTNSLWCGFHVWFVDYDNCLSFSFDVWTLSRLEAVGFSVLF